MDAATPLTILLADDDDDDCLLFSEALREIPMATRLSIVHNVDQLLQALQPGIIFIPHILFLDLNMPLVNGLQCLKEINQRVDLKKMRVVIFSTSYHQDIADQLYKNGAMHYLRKPSDFDQLKKLITQVFVLTRDEWQADGQDIRSDGRREKYMLLASNSS